MIETSVELDKKALSRALTVLNAFGERGGRAVTRSVNRALTAIKTVAGKAAREQFTIRTVKDIKSSLRVSRAAVSGDVIEGRVESRGLAISGSHFKYKPRTMDPAQNKPGKRRLELESLKGTPQTVERGFVWNSRLYRRVGRKRLPIVTVAGPSAPEMLSNEKVQQRMQARGAQVLEERLQHEVEALSQGYVRER